VKLVALAVTAFVAACGSPPLDAPFTSEIVQHDICKVVGTRPQVCDQQETVDDVRVHVVETDDENVWLFGIPRDGHPDRAILGSKDQNGGFLFVDETVTSNSASHCTLDDRLEISIAVDTAADAKKVGIDPCIALLGRENEVTTSSPGCDTVNNPPAQIVTTANRRWQKPATCTP
jgi:hypothetical protein